MTLNQPLNGGMPIQQISWKSKFLTKKDKNGLTPFMKDTMDYLESVGRYSFYNNIELKKNYEIMSGRFNVEDYIDNFDAYDLSTMIYQEMKLPSFLKHYDITSKAVKLLLGEFLKRPDITRVVAKDAQTSNEKLRIKSDLVWEFMKQSVNTEITNKMIAQGIDPNRDEFQNDEEEAQYKEAIQQKYQELTPQSIEKYLTYDFRSAAEHWGQATISDDIERFRIREQDTIEFYNMCVADRAYAHIYLTSSGYAIESWNPLTVFQQYNTQNKNTEDLSYAGRILYMSKSEIIDYMGWKMTQDQLEALYPDFNKGEGTTRNGVYGEAFNATMFPFADYREWDTLTSAIGQTLGESFFQEEPLASNPLAINGGSRGTSYAFTQNEMVQVTQAYWKSQRKVGKVNLQNPETGEITVQIVDETFDPKLFGIEEVKESYKDSDEPNTICWTWITETWQGIKINVNYQKMQNSDDRSAIYVDVKPCEFQFRGNDPRMIYTSKLPVIGTIFNNYNGRSQSVVDLIKPYQVMVNAFYNQAYHVAQKNNGKFFLMGASLLPNVKDWGGEESQEKFMTIVQNLGLGIVDDSTSAQAQSMQYGLKVLDMDESERITRLINLAMLIEQQGFMQLGITPQRQGTIQASETATGTQAAVNNSYAITEIYFEQFSNYRRRKLQMLLELSQYVESKGEGDIVKQYTTSDLGQAFIKVNSTDLLLRDMGVYLMNSAEQQRKKELVEQLLLKNNQSLMPLSKLIQTIRLDSLADVQKHLEQQEAEAQKQLQAQEKAKMDHDKQMLEMQMQEKQDDREFQASQNQLDRENKIQLEELKGISNEGSFSQETSTLDELSVRTELALKGSQIAADNAFNQQSLVNKQLEAYRKEKSEKEKLKFEKDAKEKEFKAKQLIEDKKQKAADKEDATQRQLSKEKHAGDLALQKEKARAEKEKSEKALELKNKDLEIKKLDVKLAKDMNEAEIDFLENKIKLEKEMANVKAESVAKLTKVKEEEAKKLAQIKEKEAEQLSKQKIVQNEQVHEHKLEQNEEKHTQKLREIKIKPKLKPKKK